MIEKAAYRAGAELRDEDTEITYDYTKKGGVVHKEIILPENAPPEYEDRETLWNAVEAKEKRYDARLAREIEVALQIEFDLKENIEVLREYIKENFVDKGMIADFVIHNNTGNPHSHIMLTTREVTPDGFGDKNRDWDKQENVLIWRENWAKINNRKLEAKGLEERIDHRTLKAQGIDREPTIHIGHEAWALEKKGVKTERGDINREIQKRNLERAAKNATSGERNKKHESTQLHVAQKEAPQLKIETTEQPTEESQKIAKLEKELQKIREVQKTTQYIENPIETESEPPFVSPLEKQLNAEKAMQHIEKMQTDYDAAKIAKRMNALKETYITLEAEKNPLIEHHNKVKSEIPNLEYLVETMEEHIKNIEVLRGRVEQLREVRRDLRFLDWKQKKETDEKIVQAAQKLEKAQDFFGNRFRVEPSRAIEEMEGLQEKIRAKKEELYAKQVRVQIIRDKQAALELEYHTRKLLNEIHPDHEQITQLLEQMHKPPESVREQILRERVEGRLEVISDFHFERAIEKLPQHQVDILINIREQAKERERLLRFEREQAFLTLYYQTKDKKERERLLRAEDERRNQTYERSR